jgi:post-segregation antitoxin (ccd killing protein)
MAKLRVPSERGEFAMKGVLYDTGAKKQTVSITLNSDLYAKSKSLGINASRVAERALAKELARRTVEALESEIRRDLEACDAYEAEHGSFPEMVREHYGAGEDCGPV